ncbi:LysM peptidoglycan-binding domain-containing protein [Thermoanaerobacterium sp. CMT5567-10]|uniref:LysM peptidoglycan-binding domain-containing protein n=1 Tax=Thermoanaerobacterium sp. CMT5567-10 TaxID=3061989 RepID=UPI0026DF7EE7|nr:LysM peptidoglycan-binding domain-containing protein [Thermoanaerobacterium sp. CMT5567-10]WKV08204.1 LysM peptidoglycan-binding domain-containing protein [Thermoanaerobacterium sp. CMT5567-10]
MDIYLIDPNGPTLRLPVLPEEIQIKREKQYETVEIMNIGEVDFPQGERVKEITFSSFFPKQYDPAYCKYPDIPDPQEAMNQLTAWTDSKTPIRLIITETIHNILVWIAAHDTTYKGGEPGDIYFDLTCRTYTETKVRTSSNTASSSQTINRPDTKPVPKTYMVKSGDNLWDIAKLLLGDGSKWKNIYNLNKSIIGPDPNLIKPGQRLVMPS